MQKIKPGSQKEHFLTPLQSLQNINEMILANSLFEPAQIYVLDSALADEGVEFYSTVLDNIKNMASSANVFIFVEEHLNKPILAKIEKVAEKVFSFEKIKKIKERFNTFALADALGARDRKNLWVLYQKALEHEAPEAISGVLFWKLKDMASKGNAKYKKEELNNLAVELGALLPEARRKNLDSEVALEKFILKYV